MMFPSTSIWIVACCNGNILTGEKSEYIDGILEYILNHEYSTEIKRRIIVCNYYSTSILYQYIEELDY